MKEFAAFLVVAMLAAGGYVAYRYATLPTPAEIMGSRGPDASKYSPAVCAVSSGGFERSSTGGILFYKGSARFTAEFWDGGSIRRAYSILTPEGTYYTWSEGSTEGEVLENFPRERFLTELFGNPITTAKCMIWWIPDKSLFAPPTLVNFSPPRAK